MNGPKLIEKGSCFRQKAHYTQVDSVASACQFSYMNETNEQQIETEIKNVENLFVLRMRLQREFQAVPTETRKLNNFFQIILNQKNITILYHLQRG